MTDLTSMKYFFREGKSPSGASSQDLKGRMHLTEGPRTERRARDLQPKWHLLIQMPGASQVTGQGHLKAIGHHCGLQETGTFWELRL